MVISPATDRQIRKIRKLYVSAFPKSERKPFWLIKRKATQGKMEILAITENGFAGLAIMMFYKDMALLDYFAIDPERRSGGLGSKALKVLSDMYSDRRLFLEIELPDGSDSDEIKRRRKAFYLRNGLVEANFKADLFGVPMEMLTFGCKISEEEYFGIYKNVFGSMFSNKIKLIKD